MKFPIIIILFFITFAEFKGGDDAPTFFFHDLQDKNLFLSDTLKLSKPIVLIILLHDALHIG